MFKVTTSPVDIEKIANMLGFKVVLFDFPDNISGVIRIVNNIKVIGVNVNHPNVRQRFTIAHEIGHYLSGHENFSHKEKTFVDNVDKNNRYFDPQWRQEEEADEFAAELLMPNFLLKKDMSENHLDVSALAIKYNVSEQSMWIQLINHKLVYQTK
ncbi:MAG: hypothetical protein UX35_C0009G0005 [Microgenomates group bacterium GW2011_GWA1_46_15]|nr:MAG: hypothetical protein UX00_C0003G0125 [Microgenomates group bacterium GW2011_GWB1_45_17]KKU23181.1 MAG: hypothetical protein UX35_C0009G0005 [Microgenomates group bacterium GW2011_GWA1_46_15]KKU24071.1 MAG: hypothetical protein UX36_C0002G0054 [Microgenomates group bacterium GW2011_GWC1_46_15]